MIRLPANRRHFLCPVGKPCRTAEAATSLVFRAVGRHQGGRLWAVVDRLPCREWPGRLWWGGRVCRRRDPVSLLEVPAVGCRGG
jgi:hypothetical protein